MTGPIPVDDFSEVVQLIRYTSATYWCEGTSDRFMIRNIPEVGPAILAAVSRDFFTDAAYQIPWSRLADVAVQHLRQPTTILTASGPTPVVRLQAIIIVTVGGAITLAREDEDEA